MLYALRYEKDIPVQLMQLFNKLASRSPKYKPGLVSFLLKHAGVDKRTGDLYGNRDFLNYALTVAQRVGERIYSASVSAIPDNGEPCQRALRDVDYPYVGNLFQQGRPQEVVIFIVGGITYEEAHSVVSMNSTNFGIRFILGGTAIGAILNSKRFLKDLEEAQIIARSSTGVV